MKQIKAALEFPLCDSNAGTRISLSDNSFQMNMIFSAPRCGTDDMERDAEYSKGAVWGQAFRDFNLIPYLWKANAILDDHMQSHGFKLVGVSQCRMDTSVFNGHYEQIKNSKEA